MPDGKVLRISSRSSSCADLRRHRSLSGNHGKAQLATSCPAASAITWLLADEPRLGNAARYCWCQLDLPHGEAVVFEQIGYPGPVVEKTPDPGQADQADAEFDAARPVNAGQEGILLPPGAEMIRYPDGILSSPVRNQAVASKVRCCRREISQTCLTFPLCSSER